jgi:hypothetical protein
VQGTQYVGASNGEETLTLGAKRMRTSSAAASAKDEDPEVQGTQRVGASNGKITLTLGRPGERHTSRAKASARVQDPEVRMNDAKASARAQGPEAQGTLEGSEAIVLSSASIASTQ